MAKHKATCKLKRSVRELINSYSANSLSLQRVYLTIHLSYPAHAMFQSELSKSKS